MIPRTLTVTCLVAAGLYLPINACRGPDTTASDLPVPVTAEQQIARGQAAYGAFCASCHGDAGEGLDAPPLVGPGALPLDPPADRRFRKTAFRTAMDVASFVVQAMPPKGEPRPASADDYWAILAFDLHANGIKLTEPLGPHNAEEFVLH